MTDTAITTANLIEAMRRANPNCPIAVTQSLAREVESHLKNLGTPISAPSAEQPIKGPVSPFINISDFAAAYGLKQPIQGSHADPMLSTIALGLQRRRVNFDDGTYKDYPEQKAPEEKPTEAKPDTRDWTSLREHIKDIVTQGISELGPLATIDMTASLLGAAPNHTLRGEITARSRALAWIIQQNPQAAWDEHHHEFVKAVEKMAAYYPSKA